MKNVCLAFIFCLSFAAAVTGQALLGVTYGGGNKGGGTISSFNPLSGQLSVGQSLQTPGSNPYYLSLTLAKDKKFYGMTFNGGASNAGIIFSYDPITAIYATVYNFDITNGAQPSGSLMLAADGKLYGMASFGGYANAGVIFSFDPATAAFNKLFDFDNTQGANPSGSLLQTSNGMMYGMTSSGGIYSLGTIFSFDPISQTLLKQADLDIVDGAVPLGNLVEAPDGILYGMCANGGGSQAGVIFGFNPANATFAKLMDFEYATGYYPHGSLLVGQDGNLYGMTYKGGANNVGTLFSYDYRHGHFTKLNDFDAINGGDPLGDLVQTPSGELFGMTSDGGSSNGGVIFCFDPISGRYRKVLDFLGANGGNPYGNLVAGPDGKYYGSTFQGGISNAGVIFSFNDSTGQYTKLKDFGADANGQEPSGNLLWAINGKIYGMTAFGGANNDGVIYSLNPDLTGYAKLVDFDSAGGVNPFGSLIQVTGGKLYGLTSKGGALGGGTIFSFDPGSATMSKIYDFDPRLGDNPYGSLLEAADGKLYGLTSNGGQYGYGSLFDFDPHAFTYTKLVDFNHQNGANPFGSLVQSSNGRLYGLTSQGGNGYINRDDTSGAGVIFSFDPVTSLYTKVLDFKSDDEGGASYGSFLKASNGKLYAMTNGGGTSGAGVIFCLDPDKNTFTKLHDFDFENGANPYGNLMQRADGKLYGTAYQGGANNAGVIFSFDPVTNAFNKLLDFNIADGSNPYLGAGFIEVAEAGPLPLTLLQFDGRNAGSVNQLNWQAAHQQNSAYDELQRSGNGQDYHAIAHFNATGNDHYTYIDNVSAVVYPIYYYRLKLVDTDDHATYSNVIRIDRDINAKTVVISPNPFTSRLQVVITSPVADNVSLVITGVNGQQIFNKTTLLTAGSNVIVINETSALPQGIYQLSIVSVKGPRQTITVVKTN